MNEQTNTQTDRREAREHFWKTVMVPTAKGLERFFWNLAWFAVIVALLFGGPCNGRSVQQENPPEQQSLDVSQ